jgi:hypothetical protein
MAAIFAQVNRDPVGAVEFRNPGSQDGLGRISAPGLSQSRNMVDIDAQAPSHIPPVS